MYKSNTYKSDQWLAAMADFNTLEYVAVTLYDVFEQIGKHSSHSIESSMSVRKLFATDLRGENVLTIAVRSAEGRCAEADGIERKIYLD